MTRPLATPLGPRPSGTLRPLEDFLELLVRAGFSPPDALRAYRLFFGFLQGHILDELQELIENLDESEDVLRLGLYRLPRSKFPQLRSLAYELANCDGVQLLDEGLDITLALHGPSTVAARLTGLVRLALGPNEVEPLAAPFPELALPPVVVFLVCSDEYVNVFAPVTAERVMTQQQGHRSRVVEATFDQQL